MATITIKIDSVELAREVLTHLGYLPQDDIPDLVSVAESTDDLEETDIEPASGKTLGTDLDHDPDSFDVKTACYVEASKERCQLLNAEDDIRAKAMEIEDEMDRYRYLISMTDNERRLVRDAALKLVFEFIANRNVDPALIAELCSKNVNFLHKLYEHKETQFLLMFRKENGV